ncbi:MAG: hypothetical protein QM687_08155 [Ferruginibacter sp.]
MKQLKFNFGNLLAPALIVLLASCGNDNKEARTAIDRYCELNAKEHSAPAGPEKEAAVSAKQTFEKEVDDKYFKNNKLYQLILEGMKKCDEAYPGNTQAAAPAIDAESALPSAYGDAAAVANNYCNLVDQSIAEAQGGSGEALEKAVAAKVLFEKNMEESYQGNPERRDSIFKLITPCMKKEIAFKAK